ncbi:MAG TPA: A/G-specific adenine glycosylase [Ktedonobacterales bacterium]|nr:A/G-specific adenine glycosylase [Ktedonobacterales bacterium]
MTAASQGAGAALRRSATWRLLLDWYARNGRAGLPWRQTRDPYAILVSEVMLQQTQVERVIPKYHDFLERFPTLAALAEASTADVIRAWAGLGYNTRAVRLQQVARQAMSDYDGALPATMEGLLALSGIGRYTAGAVACFAFGQQVATVDTNIRRTLWRLFRGVEPVEWPAAVTREALSLAEWALPEGQAYDWQQGLMDLGATICLARRPACERCPLTSACAAWEEASALTLFPSGEAVARLREERSQMAAAEPPAGSVAESPTPYQARPPRQRRAPQPFIGGTRYYRGRIVHALREAPPETPLTLPELGARVKNTYTESDEPWLRALVEGLARDGLARLIPPGDGDPPANAMRVALP